MPATTQQQSVGYLEESPQVALAAAQSKELGAASVSVAVGSTLRLLAKMVDASHVVEIGTGAGYATLWLLEGMTPDGTLTTIDPEVEHHRLAKATVADAGVPAARTRFINGRAREVLPRLADASYDILWAAVGASEYVDYLHEAIRLVRPGGLIVFNEAVGRASDPAARDAESVALRQVREILLEDPRLLPALLPGTEGIVVGLRLDDQAGPLN